MKDALRILKETFITSLPLAIIIIVVCVFIAPFDDMFDYVRLSVGYAGVVIGQSMFLIGLESSVLPIGREIGQALVKLKRMAFIIFFGVLFGFFATVAEPAMWVLSRQTNMIVNAVHVTIFVTVMAAGIGIFVGFALYRLIKDISIKVVFGVLYALTFLMVVFVPDQFIALAFDGSGVTTGDISVPFVLALGLGVSASLKRSGKDDSFGIIGIASVGPIITIFLYGIVLRIIHGGMPAESVYNPGAIEYTALQVLWSSLTDTAVALLPLLFSFLPFQFLLIKLNKKDFRKIMLGMIPVFLGLLIFLFSIDFGFAFAGQYIGQVFMDPERSEIFRWLILGVGFILGLAITLTEPAVTVLGDQLQDMIGIKKMATRLALAISMGLSASFAIVKIILEINILWFLIPLYLIAVIMMKFSSKMFVGLAFDSGGVVGGALSSAVLIPLTLGIAQAVATAAEDNAQSILTNGFGILAFISVTPLIAIQVMGMIYAKNHKQIE